MRELPLSQAINEIRIVCLQNHGSEQQKPAPFVLIVGAGISHPPVPLAQEMIRHCRERATSLGQLIPESLKAGVDEYSACMEAAYPDRLERQKYIESLIKSAFISQANFRLAHLLLNENPTHPRLANVVVTPNFDDFLSRGLRTFGKEHRVCDHPRTVARIDQENPDTQILQVHGSYRFYELANLRGEVEGAAAPSTETVQTMAAKLDMIFANRGFLVVGYSGWESDVIMTALRRRLAGGLPRNLYWFCYRRKEAESLPNWLREHPEVRLVLPPEAVVSTSGRKPTSGKKDAMHVESAPPESEERVLASHHVFEALIQALNMPEPVFFDNPIRSFFNQVARIAPQEDVAKDNYGLRQVLSDLQEAADAYDEKRRAVEQEKSLERAKREFLDARREADSANMISAARELAEAASGEDDLQDLLLEALEDLVKAPGIDVETGQEIIEVARKVAGDIERLASRLARILSEYALHLFRVGDVESATGLWGEVVERGGSATEPALQAQVARALVNRGAALGQLGRVEEELAAYEEVVERYGESTEPGLQEWVARALFNRGVALGQLNRDEEALAAYEQVVARYGESTGPGLQEAVARALLNRGVALRRLNRAEEALAAYQEVVARYGKSTEPGLQEQVASALFNRGVALGQLNRDEEALAAFAEVVERFGDAGELVLQDQVAKALVNRGVALGQLNRDEEALAAYEEVVARYGESTEPALQKVVAWALSSRAFRRILQGKQASREQNDEAGATDWKQAVADTQRALEKDEQSPLAFQNLAYAQFLLGKEIEARDNLQQAFKLGGEEMYRGALDDATQHRIDRDEAWEALVEEVWGEMKPTP